MRIAVLLLVVICTTSSAGCSSAPQRSSQQAAIDQSDQIYVCSATCSDSDAMRAIKHAFDQCTATQNLYERRGFNSKTAQFTVGLIGALAGAVAAPLAKGSGAKAWAGLSGTTNGIQTHLGEDFSYDLTVQERVAVSNAMLTGVENIRHANTAFSRMLEAEAMENFCRQASARADAAFHEAIASAAKTADENDQKILVGMKAITTGSGDQSAAPNAAPAPSGTAATPPQPVSKPASEGRHP